MPWWGDTQTIYGMTSSGGDTSMQMVVTSTGTKIINGFTKRTYTAQHVSFPYYFDFGDSIVEDIGNVFISISPMGILRPCCRRFKVL